MSETTVRALVFDGPVPDTSTSRIGQIALPAPGPGQVAIDVHHAGVNFKDVMARRGDAGHATTWPFVPGLEVSGTVRAFGSGVIGHQLGDRVTAYTGCGGLAEVAVAGVDLVAAVPAEVDLERAAAAPGALTTAGLLLDFGRLRRGEAVLVHSAAGGVGQAVAHLARLAGAGVVLGTVGSRGRVAAAVQAGYDAVLVRGADVAGSVRAHTGGHGVDLVLDPQGTELLDLDLEVAAPGGRIALFGNATGQPLAPLPPLGRLLAGNVAVMGFSLGALATTAPDRLTAALRTVLDHLANGALDIELTGIDGLAAAPEAQQALAEGRGRGKQVVRVRPA